MRLGIASFTIFFPRCRYYHEVVILFHDTYSPIVGIPLPIKIRIISTLYFYTASISKIVKFYIRNILLSGNIIHTALASLIRNTVTVDNILNHNTVTSILRNLYNPIIRNNCGIYKSCIHYNRLIIYTNRVNGNHFHLSLRRYLNYCRNT